MRDPERALCAAIILQALADAARGDDGAAAWLDGEGAGLAELLGCQLAGWKIAVARYRGRIRGDVWQPPKNGAETASRTGERKAQEGLGRALRARQGYEDADQTSARPGGPVLSLH